MGYPMLSTGSLKWLNTVFDEGEIPNGLRKRNLFMGIMAHISLFFHAIIAFLLWPTMFAENHTDHLSLLAIKKSITQDPQRVLDTWNTTLHFCQWQGVTCGRRHPRVTMLDLTSRGLVGSLSPQIGNLSFLRVIRLENNNFNGVIPPQLGGLFRLQKLNLFNNSFEGEVPASLSNCTRLDDLRLARNKLVGKLPQQLGSLVNLVNITIHANGFTGGIPSFLGNLTSLRAISAFDNRLGGTIPDAFGQLYNLQQIGFGANQLHGTIPPSLYNLTSLMVLSLPDNQITGGLSENIGLQLPNLERFEIWGNRLTGSIPFSLSNCSHLRELSLAENGFTGKVNIDFRHIPNLRHLALFNNSLGSQEPNEMNFIDTMINCSKLEMLLVQLNQFRGVLPSSLGNLSSQLAVISFSANLMYGPLPSGVGNLVKLERLDMQYNQFTGVIPSELGSLRNLRLLYLQGNNFTGSIPDSIGNMSLLNEVWLNDNTLEGQIPPNLGNCTNLVTLDLSVNNLTGPIPKEVFQLSSLSTTLNLAQNHLVGPLPKEIGELINLRTLDVSKNNLVGEIPDAIGSCKSLEYLDMKANSFEGPIPLRMNALKGIKILDLSSNNISGQIPRLLEQLAFSSLNLSFNNLDGEVPMGGVFKNASVISIDGNNGLCGGVPELRLPKCALVARSKKGFRVILVVIPLCSFLVLSMASSLLFCWQRRKRQAQPIGVSPGQPFSRVSYGSIRKATDEFSEQNLIGTGTFSDVYKGILEEAGGGMVAIKVLKLGNQGAFKSFMAECEALKNIRHRNLVKIITSCSSVDYQGSDFKALIYEYMPNGSLERWLHPSPQQEIETEEAAAPRRLSLCQRVTIAIDVAHAIHYLHQECETPIIHCDLKPSNILLASDMVAHIGDFGLAKFIPLKPHESSSIGIRGTIGYVAPEYGVGSEMTKEGDIYSFGILLLEMITGKRPTDEEMEAANVNRRRSGEDGARRWKRLEECMISLATIGLACSMESPRERMDSSKIVQELHRINRILIPNRKRNLLMAYLSLFFHAIIAFLLFPATLAENHTDHLSLLAIKKSITQDPQRVLDTWNTSLQFCRWKGVTCGRRHRRVTKLDLGSRGLVGSLSPHIGNLTFLREIWLDNNTFNGVIPPQLGGLFRLQKLVLVNNSFEGEVPASLSNCTRLDTLGLAQNKLVGKLPQQLGSLVNLVNIIIHANSFTGGIPSFLGNLTSLEVISTFENPLGGNIPDFFGQLHNLRRIQFDTNRLNGMIPPSLYNLTSLKVLNLVDNQIIGGLPKDIGLKLPNLELFHVSMNKLKGSIPFSFSNCSNLVKLTMAINSFTGKVNINFRGIPNLRSLELSNNSLGSWEPDEMNFIDSMINCTNLEKLSFHGNQFRGAFPSSMGNLSSQLRILDLDNNLIYGTLPSGIGNLVKLEWLSVFSNHLTGTIPNELGNLKFLLDLSYNRLQGQIPPSLGKSKSLMVLYLSTNNLSGLIPKEFFQLSSMVDLDVYRNHLVGPLPQQIGNLKSLRYLDLSENDLIGQIPGAIMSCTSLEYVYLEENSFDGPIPPAFGALRGIRDLDLSSNNFSGKIPIFLEQLNFSTLNLSFNNLDGEVPKGGIFANASAIAINGNGRLCGGISELGLRRCDTVARSKKGFRIILVVIPLCSFLVLAMALSLFFCWQKRKRQAQPTEPSLGQPFSRVSYGSIRQATDGFSEQNLIGTGTFSSVYKGIIEAGGAVVAIKVLKLGNQGAFKSFMAECEALKNIRHRNLVKIVTSCSSVDYQGNDFKALIYEYMPNGNLDTWLHPSHEQEIEIEKAAPRRLSFRQRLTIAIDVAHAIHYLHQECETPIIHCDLKPSNILLDNDMVAHIGDFGLAKFLPLKPHESSSIGVRGTIGYAAPEYGVGSEMAKEGDIYSFGILLLEMITGKRPTDEGFEEGLNLHEYVKMALPDHVMKIVEMGLLHEPEEEMEVAKVNRRSSDEEARRWKRLEECLISLATTGLACSTESPRERMDSRKLVHELHRIMGNLAGN
ncbi:hypothetical protein OSB04_027197 [Centaurea solstitialis]|uniref:non-specific serine/threonine protein kinase n=1 Tax=Centaurea solstitialis TaxID=347529 RepID=A0AA38SRL4_9ASTR|nr:hypothetical protein OSB04_027197 [Centaurea solstitialis]